MDLENESCEACKAEGPAVSVAQLDEFLAHYSHWQVDANSTVRILQRSYKFDDFKQALDFTANVGQLAETHQHHPEIILSWGQVVVRWWTHKIDDLHRNDLILAAKTETLYSQS